MIQTRLAYDANGPVARSRLSLGFRSKIFLWPRIPFDIFVYTSTNTQISCEKAHLC
eukprot:m.800313 g.800313  ORF g.800313 m.800313 type:complete len:56 (+) comp23355_c0_seq3:2638-2805(+)